MVRVGPLVVALVIVGSVGAVGVVADGTFVSMTAETVPEHPSAEQPFALAVHFDSAPDGGERYDIEAIRVYDATNGGEHVGTESAAPSIAPGDSRTVRIEDLELDEPGTHELRIEATLEADGRERVLETTRRVDVYGTEPALGVDVAPGVAGGWRSLNVTLANRADAPIRGVTVGLESEDARFRPAERVASSLASGGERTLPFETRSSRLGAHELAVSISYQGPDGTARSVERTMTINFTAPAAPSEARLTAVNVTATQSGLRLDGSVVNDGTNGIGGVSVAVADRDGVTPTAPSPASFVGSIGAGERGSFTVTAALRERSSIPLRVSYRVNGVEYERIQEIAYDGPSAVEAIQMTDLSVRPSAAGVRINGSAANVGTQDLTGVTVEVLEQSGVRPVAPQSAAFVGSVSQGGAESFEITAAIAADRETIPLSVTYAVDGVTYNATTAISYDGESGVQPLELTGVSATPSAGSVEIEGSAANLGSQQLQSVIVEVGEADGVTPVPPQPEYFVGPVDGSDFASFSVTAGVEGNRSTIPLTVRYKVDGVSYEMSTDVAVGSQPDPPQQQADSGGGFPIVVVVVGLVLLGIGTVAYRRLR